MTFLDLAKRLGQEVGAAGAGPTSVSGQTGEYGRLVDWVRDAWTEIQARHRDWSFLWAEFSTAVTDAESDYDVAPDVRYIIPDTVRLDGERLAEMNYQEYARLYKAHESMVQRAFTILPTGKLRLIPAANGTLTGEYYRTPQTLAADADEPLAPAHLHDTIIAQALLYYATYEDAPEIYQDARARLRRWITRMQSECLPTIDAPGPLV